MTDDVRTPAEEIAHFAALLEASEELGWSRLHVVGRYFELTFGPRPTAPLASDQPAADPPVTPASAGHGTVASPPPALPDEPAGVDDREAGLAVHSPVPGTFYLAPSPHDPPFVQVGDTVVEGQQLGIVEIMKLMTAVNAPVNGSVVAVEVANAASVDEGEVLFRLEPAT